MTWYRQYPRAWYPRTKLTERLWFAVSPLFLISIGVVIQERGHLVHGWWGAPVVTAYCIYQGFLARLRRRVREAEEERGTWT